MSDEIQSVLKGESEGVVLEGDCLERLKKLPDNCVDSVITDPPAAISMMNLEWDSDKGGRDGWIEWLSEVMRECKRVMKPGGMALVWGIPKRSHWTALAIERAGFEIRTKIYHLFGQGFPKSFDISKKIDQCGFRNEEFDDVRQWLREKVKERGLTHKEIDKALGNENSHMASHFLGTSQPMLPTEEQWSVLKKLLDIDDDIDRPPKYEKFEREIIGHRKVHEGVAFTSQGKNEVPITKPATPEAERWDGYGTGIKPAAEEWILAMNPKDGTFAENALEWGVAGLNIDECRIKTSDGRPAYSYPNGPGGMWSREYQEKNPIAKNWNNASTVKDNEPSEGHSKGRWPANVTLSHTRWCRKVGTKKVKNESGSVQGDEPSKVAKNCYGEYKDRESFDAYGDDDGMETVEEWDCPPCCPIRMLGEDSGKSNSPDTYIRGCSSENKNVYGEGVGENSGTLSHNYGDSGTAARFFKRFKYTAKPSTKEKGDFNNHPTVKSLELMRYLCRLTKTPEGGIVLDPFGGSGTTALACKLEDRRYILIEKDPEYVEIIRKRIKRTKTKTGEDGQKEPVFLDEDQVEKNEKLSSVFS